MIASPVRDVLFRPFEPVVSEELCGVLRADASVSAVQTLCRAVLLAAPADSLGMLRIQRSICHLNRSLARGTACAKHINRDAEASAQRNCAQANTSRPPIR